MKQVIFKYFLHINCENTYNFPPGSKLLHIGIQEQQIFMWVQHPAPFPKDVKWVKWTLSNIFTGEEFTPVESDVFVGTVVQGFPDSGYLVTHWFKREETV